MASGTVSCHRIYNVPPSAHSSSLGPSLAGPPAARTATAAEAMVATGGVSRSKLPTTCLLTEDHADLLTEYVNRGVPYHAESALSSAQESSAHAGALVAPCHARPSAAKAPSRRSARVPAAAVSCEARKRLHTHRALAVRIVAPALFGGRNGRGTHQNPPRSPAVHLANQL